MTKKMIAKYAGYVCDDVFCEQRLCDILEAVKQLIEKYGEDSTLHIGYDEGIDISVTSYTEETDEEYQKRLVAEAASKEWVRQRDLETLARLRQQYGV